MPDLATLQSLPVTFDNDVILFRLGALMLTRDSVLEALATATAVTEQAPGLLVFTGGRTSLDEPLKLFAQLRDGELMIGGVDEDP